MKRNVAGSGEGFAGGRAEEIAKMLTSLQGHAKQAGQDIGLGIGTDQEGGEYSDEFHTNTNESYFSGLVSAFSTANVVTQLYASV